MTADTGGDSGRCGDKTKRGTRPRRTAPREPVGRQAGARRLFVLRAPRSGGLLEAHMCAHLRLGSLATANNARRHPALDCTGRAGTDPVLLLLEPFVPNSWCKLVDGFTCGRLQRCRGLDVEPEGCGRRVLADGHQAASIDVALPTIVTFDQRPTGRCGVESADVEPGRKRRCGVVSAARYANNAQGTVCDSM